MAHVLRARAPRVGVLLSQQPSHQFMLSQRYHFVQLSDICLVSCWWLGLILTFARPLSVQTGQSDGTCT